MSSLNAPLYAVLFSATIVATYFSVRLKWLHAYPTFIAGSMINSLFFFMFSIARGNGLVQAITVGVGLGLIFTALSVVLAATFRNAEVVREEKIMPVMGEVKVS